MSYVTYVHSASPFLDFEASEHELPKTPHSEKDYTSECDRICPQEHRNSIDCGVLRLDFSQPSIFSLELKGAHRRSREIWTLWTVYVEFNRGGSAIPPSSHHFTWKSSPLSPLPRGIRAQRPSRCSTSFPGSDSLCMHGVDLSEVFSPTGNDPNWKFRCDIPDSEWEFTNPYTSIVTEVGSGREERGGGKGGRSSLHPGEEISTFFVFGLELRREDVWPATLLAARRPGWKSMGTQVMTSVVLATESDKNDAHEPSLVSLFFLSSGNWCAATKRLAGQQLPSCSWAGCSATSCSESCRIGSGVDRCCLARRWWSRALPSWAPSCPSTGSTLSVGFSSASDLVSWTE